MATFDPHITFNIDSEDGRPVRHISLARGREHVTDNRTGECWCNPRVIQACPICFAEPAPDSPPCLACRGEGWGDWFTSDPEWPTVIIHNEGT
jgi:hypothetical protein